MCDETVGNCLAALKCFPDWFVTGKMLKTFYDSLLSNDDILFLDEDFRTVIFMILKSVFSV